LKIRERSATYTNTTSGSSQDGGVVDTQISQTNLRPLAIDVYNKADIIIISRVIGSSIIGKVYGSCYDCMSTTALCNLPAWPIFICEIHALISAELELSTLSSLCD
jgi:hypothetical protein